MKQLAITVIKGYKLLISPILPPACRFQPTCSEYTIEALEKFGFLHGSWLGLKRISRCNPFTEGGYDPVPHKHH